jgi:hypothetical protein
MGVDLQGAPQVGKTKEHDMQDGLGATKAALGQEPCLSYFVSLVQGTAVMYQEALEVYAAVGRIAVWAGV